MPIFEVVNRQSDVINNLMKMLALGTSNDVTIVLSDGEIRANKDVLCASSDYFATMFSNEAFDECKNGVVPMKNVKKVVMEGLIQFLFSGLLDLKRFDIKDLLELMNLTQFMFLHNLFTDIEVYIIANLDKIECTAKDIYQAFSLVYKYQLLGVKSKFIEIVKRFLQIEVWEEDNLDSLEFLKFTSGMVKDVLEPDDSEDSMSAISRFRAFDFWYSKTSCLCTEVVKTKILENLPLDKFTGSELLQVVRNSRLYSQESISERLMEIIENYEEEISELKLKYKEERESKLKLETRPAKRKSSLQTLPIRRRSMIPHHYARVPELR